ncbi:MAG: hypothetical protein IIA60_07065 [Candidatus Marinimicrobia bacterium]|nr:hypothetical protein [Candidatus Neomarinimicrobiota bacterium]
MLRIPEDVEANLNAKAKELLGWVRPPYEWDGGSLAPYKLPKPSVSATVESKEIEDPQFGQADDHGQFITRFFLDDNKLAGLERDAYEELVIVAETMQALPELRNVSSIATLESLIFSWIEESFLDLTQQDMVAKVLELLEPLIKENEIWIPVPILIISENINIGNIELRTIDERLLVEWQEFENSRFPDSEERLESIYKDYRKKYQGRAAAFIKIIAEPNYAEEVAFRETDRAISVLRYYDPALQDPNLISYCGLEGRFLTPTSFTIHTENDANPVFHKGYHGTLPLPWILDPPYLSIIRSNGLDIMGTMLTDDAITPFEQAIMDSILIYTRSAFESEPVDKIIYILAALETILLRGKKERISSNVRERMAEFIGDGTEDKKMLISDFKRVYKLRSDFLHHGQKRNDVIILERFMVNTWLLFNNLLLEKDKYKTKAEFLKSLDDNLRTTKSGP